MQDKKASKFFVIGAVYQEGYFSFKDNFRTSTMEFPNCSTSEAWTEKGLKMIRTRWRSWTIRRAPSANIFSQRTNQALIAWSFKLILAPL